MTDHIDELIESVFGWNTENNAPDDMIGLEAHEIRAVAEAALALGTETVEKRRDRIRRDFARELLTHLEEAYGSAIQLDKHDHADFMRKLREEAGE